MAQNDAELAYVESQRSSRQPESDSDTDGEFGTGSAGDSSQDDYQQSGTHAVKSESSHAPNIQESTTKSGAMKLQTVKGFSVDEDASNVKESIHGSTRLNPGVPDTGVSGATSHIPLQSSMSSIQNVSKDQVAEDQKSGIHANDGHIKSFNGVLDSVASPSPTGGALAQTANVKVTSSLMSDASSLPAFASSSLPTTALPKARLPHDVIGLFEDRIKEDPRGDTEAWLGLINEHRKRNKLDDARAVLDRFLKVFPMAAEQLVAYAELELEHENFFQAEEIFKKYLISVPSVHLWKVYLDYIRRRNNLSTDSTGQARAVISQAYDFVLSNVGIDPESGNLWQEYLQFIRSGPGVAGGSSWQDQQKMDQLRKAFQRAICIPNQQVTNIWREYNTFENGLNKQTGRKFLQDKSASYVSANSAFRAWQNLSRGLERTTVPKLPPAPGFDGDEYYTSQIAIWKQWIAWEKGDPLVLKDEDLTAYRARIFYVYTQALMALRFWPEMWFDAAEFCFQNDMDSQGDELLLQGTLANPESCLLAFKRADRLEITLPQDEGDDGLNRRGAGVREPFDKLLDSLYELLSKNKVKESKDLARIEQSFKTKRESSKAQSQEDEDEVNSDEEKALTMAETEQKAVVQKGAAAQEKLLSRMISYVWIGLMRAMRRVQGKGSINGTVGGSRQIFADARKRGKILTDVYAASALMEYHCYKDPAANKIFDRGARLFPEDAEFALQYLKHLVAINDVTNARAFFETAVSRLAQNPENIPSSKPIYSFFHEYESNYGELSQLRKLEKRMKDLFPEDSQVTRFSHRFATKEFDPTVIRLVVSPATQLRPKSFAPPPAPQTVVPSIETATIRSPKRPLEEDSEDSQPASKLPRGTSPLKGAAGRRLDQQKRQQMQSISQDLRGTWSSPLAAPPPSLPREVMFLLSIIPGAESYKATRFKSEEIVRLLRDTNIPTQPNRLPRVPPPSSSSYLPAGQPNGPYSYPR